MCVSVGGTHFLFPSKNVQKIVTQQKVRLLFFAFRVLRVFLVGEYLEVGLLSGTRWAHVRKKLVLRNELSTYYGFYCDKYLFSDYRSTSSFFVTRSHDIAVMRMTKKTRTSESVSVIRQVVFQT
jgi:hypothetical protein